MATSWGKISVESNRATLNSLSQVSLLTRDQKSQFLPYGLGRSYGDSCLISDGTSIQTTGIDKLIAFDRTNGIICCEAGVSIDDLINVIVPAGWFLPVTPGTKFVTIGGAIANDVHGKNHHVRGTFGSHVLELTLIRSNGEEFVCRPDQNQDLFKASIGGLGLTGLISKAAFQLIPITSSMIDVETIKTNNLNEFFEISDESDHGYEYSVSWIDCMASGKQLGRGLFNRGNHKQGQHDKELTEIPQKPLLTVPFDAPNWLINPLSIRIFNELYFHKQRKKVLKSHSPINPFFYPLDFIHHWNRLYGKRGFFQYQFVTPLEEKKALFDIFTTIQKSKLGSCLAVFKKFGDHPSPGLMSFPQPGYTLALDFANRGPKTKKLFEELDQIVVKAGGRLYPAKDACMSPDTFKAGYPQFQEFAKYIDPMFTSDFWKRVTK